MLVQQPPMNGPSPSRLIRSKHARTGPSLTDPVDHQNAFQHRVDQLVLPPNTGLSAECECMTVPFEQSGHCLTRRRRTIPPNRIRGTLLSRGAYCCSQDWMLSEMGVLTSLVAYARHTESYQVEHCGHGDADKFQIINARV